MLGLAALEAGVLSALHIIHNSFVGAVGLQTLAQNPFPPTCLAWVVYTQLQALFFILFSAPSDILTLVSILTATCVSMLQIGRAHV